MNLQNKVISDIRAVDMPFDFEHEDNTWGKYGITEVPLLVRADNGEVFDDKAFKGIFQDGKYRKIVGRNYIVFPNEEVDLIVTKLVEQYKDEYGIYLFKSHYARNSDIKFWELRTESSKFQKAIEGSKISNDVVNVGLIIRNSLGAGVSFGADLFTFRQVCTNGAIARGKDLGNLKIKHYGQNALEEMVNSLERRLGDMLWEGMDLLKYYERMTQLKMKQELAEKLGNTFAKKYLPEYIVINEDKAKKLKPEIVLTNEGKSMTLWNTFNHITDPVWHNEHTRFNTKSYMTTTLHKLMFEEVDKEALK